MLTRRALLTSTLAAPLAAALPACMAPKDRISGGFVGPSAERGHALRDGAFHKVTTTPDQQRTQVVIVGGGIAGLSAARALRQRGIEDFVLLELEDQPGGNARSMEQGGMPCPMGAHYLPLPNHEQPELQALLAELGLLEWRSGRWQVSQEGERHLCHSVQERLYYQGHWQEGLLPVQGVPQAALDAYARFAKLVQAQRQPGKFALPVRRNDVRWAADMAALDQITFAQWLDQQQLTEPHLRWYLDYCCRDDFGAPASVVSAWAGLHYFASRHGFQAPHAALDDSDPREAVFVWPQGNDWLVQRLAKPLASRVRSGQIAHRVEVGKDGITVDAIDASQGRATRWQARHCILATPLFVGARMLQGADSFVQSALQQAVQQLRYAPWLVANLQLREPLRSKRNDVSLAWDNVIYGKQALGYVNATHQSLLPYDDATVLTHYRTLCESGSADAFKAARQTLLQTPWAQWRDQILGELQAVHPDLPENVVRIDIARWGHAMSCPVPGMRSSTALTALQALPPSSRVQFAHSDMSGYSVFEEAFAQGVRAARLV